MIASEEAAEEARQAVYEDANADSDGTGAVASSVDAFDVDNNGTYICTQDCSGHEAGFEWAQQHDVADPSDCGGTSNSFIEGCEAFAEERQQQADQQTQEAAEEAAATAAELAAENYDDSSGDEYEAD